MENSRQPTLNITIENQQDHPSRAEILQYDPKEYQLDNNDASVNNKLEPKNFLMGLNIKQRTRIKAQIWDYADVKKIFKLYSQFGSQWKIMQNQFKDRAANSIKNRFYTVIRTLLKLLFKQSQLSKQKLPHQIPSKVILKFYEGRQEFIKFKGFGKKILKTIDYNLESKQLKKIAEQNIDQIRLLYSLIFQQKKLQKQSQTSLSKKRNIKSKSQSNLNVNLTKLYDDIQGSPQRSLPVDMYKTKTETTYPNIEEQVQISTNPYEGIVFFVPLTSYYEPFQSMPYYNLF